ncbi:MAG: NAD(P)(+) transhydrogenase (Re/Si-specific) subunit beta [Myxococcota bacterium]
MELTADVRVLITSVGYLVAAVLFVLGLKGLAHPRTAVRGNLMSAIAMLIAVVVTLADQQIVGFTEMSIGVAIGTVIGVLLAARIEMTAMPQLVALFNGFGGLASLLVAAFIPALLVNPSGTIGFLGVEVPEIGNARLEDYQLMVATGLSALIGAVTFTGSVIAFFKLQGIVVPSGAVTSPIFKVLNLVFFLGSVGLLIASVATGFTELPLVWGLIGAALILGVTLTVPIGGADMPVVIALLNSYSGLAACATGFVLNNQLLIIAGSLVGASGIILTQIMCKAMNRTLTNVLFGGLGAESGPVASADEVYAGKVTSASAEEAAMVMEGAERVVIVPGYGMAVSQAQHAVRDLTNLLVEQGKSVEFAVHSVAGRMPGHMNVLLAEADIPYERLRESDDINPEFPEVDVVLVIGANDVVNPEARTNPESVIAGMPIVDVDFAKTVMVVKRSLSPGFAGIPNPLFAADNTMMLFGDGKKMVLDIVQALKEY